MKKFFSTILFIVIVFSSFAQKQKVNYLTTFDDKFIHFGFTLGLNVLDFNVTNYNPFGENPNNKLYPSEGVTPDVYIRSDVANLVPGFTVAMVSSMRLTNDLNLRFQPGMSFGERQLTYNIPVIDINNPIDPNNDINFYSIKSTFLDFPLVIKYKARRINNGRPYVIFGTSFKQDISRTAQEDLVKLKKSGFYAVIGTGWDTYFPFFRLSVEAKVSLGLNDQLEDAPAILQRQYYAQSIKKLRSNVFTLSFHFE